MMSAKYLSVFLKTYMPTRSITTVPMNEMPMSFQLIGAVPSSAARAFWMTPIMIQEERAPHDPYRIIHWMLTINPMNYAVRVYRSALLPGHWAAPQDLLILAACGAIMFVLGGFFFRYMKKGFADVL